MTSKKKRAIKAKYDRFSNYSIDDPGMRWDNRIVLHESADSWFSGATYPLSLRQNDSLGRENDADNNSQRRREIPSFKEPTSFHQLTKTIKPTMQITCFRHALFVGITLASAAFITGCASAGRDFKYQSASSLELGQTRSSEYQVMFGKPNAVQVKDTADGKFELVRYLYAYADMGTARSRLLDLEFRDDVLNAYNYLSSFDKDRTVVNANQLKEIQRGNSKKADVQRILGKPHGMARCPSQNADFKDKCAVGTEIWVWSVMGKLSTFGAAYGGDQVEIHNIFIVFDKDGIVTDVESSQTKNL